MNNTVNNAKTNENHEWFTVSNAARILGVSKQAIRQRIYRNTIPNRKEADGTVYVRITEHSPETNGENTSESHTGNTGKTNTRSYVENNGESHAENKGDTDSLSRELIDELRDRLAFAERQLESEQEANRENRRIIAGLVQRVPELEAASEHRYGSETASEVANKGDSPEQQEDVQRRSWLYKFFFGP